MGNCIPKGKYGKWKDVGCILGFDVSDLSEYAHQDLESMDASAAHVLSLLSTKPPNSKFQN